MLDDFFCSIPGQKKNNGPTAKSCWPAHSPSIPPKQRTISPAISLGPVPSFDLLYQPVVLLASPDSLLTCWHPTETYSGWDQVGDPGEPRGYEGVKHNVAKRWQKAERHSATAADLGVLVMHELALTYAPASRQLYAALEEWERDLYKDVQDDQTKLQVDPRMLNPALQAACLLTLQANPLHVQGPNEDLEKAWLPATDPGQDQGG